MGSRNTCPTQRLRAGPDLGRANCPNADCSARVQPESLAIAVAWRLRWEDVPQAYASPSTASPGQAARPRSLLWPDKGSGADRTIAHALQHRQDTLGRPRIQATGGLAYPATRGQSAIRNPGRPARHRFNVRAGNVYDQVASFWRVVWRLMSPALL